MRNKIKNFRKPFLILYGYSLLIYLPLLLLRLTNDIDGLWNQDDYLAGTWELSIGRWFWPWLDRARFGISLDPLPGVFALALYVCGFLLILSILGYRADSPVSILAGFLFLASTAITCQMSHGYMVITFGISFLLAVLAVSVCAAPFRGSRPWERPKSDPISLCSVILSGVLIALMMGCYQAGIGTTCLVALLFFMRLLSGCAGQRRGLRPSCSFALRMFLSILVGAVLYEVLLHLHLSVFHIELSSYQGFSEIGPAYFLGHLGIGVRHAYEEMKQVLFTNVFRFNRLQTHRWFWIVYLVPMAPVVADLVRIFRSSETQFGARTEQRTGTEQETGIGQKTGIGQETRIEQETWPEGGRAMEQETAAPQREKGNAAVRMILYVLSFLLIPLFAGSFYLLAPEAETHMQMLLPYSLILPLLLCGWNAWEPMRETANCGLLRKIRKDWYRRAAAVIFLVGSFFLIYGGIAMNVTDQYAMYVGRRATSTLAENILNGAEALGQDPVNGQLEIIGVPAKSPLFAVKDAYYQANDYAQYGNWSSDVSFSRISWQAMYRNYLRTNVSLAQGDTEATIAALPEVQAMPVFPTPGAIQNLYGVTVIRISE